MHIIPANDLNSVRQLLMCAGLPSEDIDPHCAAHFYLIEADGEAQALVGIECYGGEALLRSLTVKAGYRNQGLAARLVAHAQQVAVAEGASTLYLLTTGAADYFRRRGFVEVSREATPLSIRQSREFAQLCPADATVMCREL